MGAIILALIIVLLIGGIGFAIHVLWWIALIALIVWLLGFVVRVGEGSRARRRWYYW